MTDKERKLLKVYARKIKTAVKERISGELEEMVQRQIDSVRLEVIDEIVKEEMK